MIEEMSCKPDDLNICAGYKYSYGSVVSITWKTWRGEALENLYPSV